MTDGDFFNELINYLRKTKLFRNIVDNLSNGVVKVFS